MKAFTEKIKNPNYLKSKAIEFAGDMLMLIAGIVIAYYLKVFLI